MSPHPSTPTSPSQADPPAASPTDPWSIWFSRLIQIVGLALVIYEALLEENDRPWLLLVAAAMMLGGVGLQLLVRWALGRIA